MSIVNEQVEPEGWLCYLACGVACIVPCAGVIPLAVMFDVAIDINISAYL